MADLSSRNMTSMTHDIQNIITHLPCFEKLIIHKHFLSNSTEECPNMLLLELFARCKSEKTLKEKLTSLISILTYQECNNIFKIIFQDYSSELSKETAKNNVRRISGDDEETFSNNTYGEIEYFSFCNLLERLDIKEGDSLYDLGHGTGKGIIAASLMFGDKLEYIRGVELLSDLNDLSKTAVDSYKTLINSIEYSELFQTRQKSIPSVDEGDFLLEPFVSQWVNSSIVFANSTCFSLELMCQLAKLAINMKKNSIFISFTNYLPCEEFEMIDKVSLGMSWGLATCYIQRHK